MRQDDECLELPRPGLQRRRLRRLVHYAQHRRDPAPDQRADIDSSGQQHFGRLYGELDRGDPRDQVPAAGTLGHGQLEHDPRCGRTSKGVSGKATGSWGYRTRACNAAGCGGWTAQRTVQVTRVPTGSPTVTASTPAGTGAFAVSWGTVAGAATYELDERVGSGSWARIQQGTARSRTVTGKGPGTYQYRARGCNTTGCGPYSGAVSVTLSLLPTPTGLSVSGGEFFCEVGWSASGGATRYELQRGGLEIYRGAQPSVFLTTACLANQVHQVRACSGVGCSAWSAPVFWTGPPGGGGPIQYSIPETGGEE